MGTHYVFIERMKIGEVYPWGSLISLLVPPFFFCIASHCLTQPQHFSIFSHPLLDLLMALIARSLLGLEISLLMS